MSRNLQSLPELKRALALYAETVCSHYLSAGEKSGHYWRVGDIDGSRGRSMFVSLAGASAGQWSDPAQGTHGDLLDIIAHHEGTFGRACRAARALIGTSPAPPPLAPGDEPNPHLDAAKHNWTCARPISRTHASRYLASRDIAIRPDAAVLRFHSSAAYRSQFGFEHYPALLAAVTDHAGAFIGIQRTYLDHHAPRKADVEDPRRTLGQVGGGAIRLDDTGDTLAVGEGLETMLSIRTAFPTLPIAAAMGTRLLTQWLPSERHRRILVAADSGTPGETAAQALAERLRAHDIAVTLARPVEGGDFNEDLQILGARALRAALAPAIHELCG